MKLGDFLVVAIAAIMTFGALATFIPSAVNGSPAYLAQASSTNTTLTVGTLLGGETVTDQNPLTDTGIASDVTGVTYADSLLMEFSNGSYIPWTATSWSITNGGKTMTFNLVTNASWVNGTTKAMPFTSQDVVYTFQTLMANSTLDINGIDSYLTNVTAPDNHTVVFTLSQPNLMAFFFIGSEPIIPYAWHAYVNNMSDIGNYLNMNIGHQLSMGPMSLQSVSGNYITFVANPFFFAGKPHFQKEVWEQFTSTSSQIDSLKTGTIDATYVDSNSIYSSLLNITGVSTVVFKDTFNLNLWFDDTIAPYNNTDFRIGLSYLINYTQIAQIAEGGLAGPTNSGGLPWTLSNYYNASDTNYSYNTSMANHYFQLAGLSINGSTGLWQYANGTTVDIQMFDIPQSDWDTAMSLIQSSVTADNFETQLSIVPTGTWAAILFAAFPFHYSTNYTYPQASFYNFGPLFANPWYDLWAEFDGAGTWNFEFYNNPTLNALFNSSVTLVNDPAALNHTLKEIQGIVSSQMPVIPVVGSDLFFGYRSDAIGGVYPNVQMSSPLDSLYCYPVNGSPTHAPGSSTYLYYIIGGVVVVAVVVGIVGLVIRNRNLRKKE